jgi:hypothetical protein
MNMHTSYTPSKDFEKFGYKNAIKHNKKGHPSPLDITATQSTSSKEFENDCASIIKNNFFDFFLHGNKKCTFNKARSSSIVQSLIFLLS